MMLIIQESSKHDETYTFQVVVVVVGTGYLAHLPR